MRAEKTSVRQSIVSPVPKARLGGDEEPLELDLDAELLQGLAADTVLERLVRPVLRPVGARARGVVRLADQREPLAVEDEERDVVTRSGDRPASANSSAVTSPSQGSARLAVARPERSQHGLGDVHPADGAVSACHESAGFDVRRPRSSFSPRPCRSCGSVSPSRPRAPSRTRSSRSSASARSPSPTPPVCSRSPARRRPPRGGDEPIRPVFEALAAQETLVAPLALRVACGNSACPLGAAAIVPLRLSDGPVGALIAYATDGAPLADDDVDLLTSLGDQLSAQLQLSELAGSARAAASAELQALQAQIEPHFLFNCLNTIASFTRTEPERARELILAFADYCRWTLARPGEFISLEEELRHVRSYLALEQARFGPQLQVRIDATPGALAVRLPPFLVQPLVENAVKHGKTERPLDLLVRARVRRGRLRVTVRAHGGRGEEERFCAGARAGDGRERRPRPRQRARPPDCVLRRRRAAEVGGLRHRRAAAGPGRVSGRVEGAGGNREVPPIDFLGGAEATSEEEGGSWGKPGFPHATEPEAEEAA